MKFKRLIYIAILVVMIASTVVPVFFFQPKGEPISATGTVQLINLEGGFYGIAGDDGLN